MPVHRSITGLNRNNRNNRRNNTFNICGGIILFYVLLSLILASNQLDTSYILIINFITFSSGVLCFCICIRNYDYEDNLDVSSITYNNNNLSYIPTITAYQINDSENDSDIIPVIGIPITIQD
tara:strand:+ start:13889 stop:14257 length:369 start_codon:yes stop_codon:yes gene_type:complete